MAHFAELDNNGIVLRVVVVSNDVTIPVDPAPEIEQLGINFLKKLIGRKNKNWKQTSYNTHSGGNTHGKPQNRKNYAGKGYRYDSRRNAFIPPKRYPSWILNEETSRYDPPIPYPDDGQDYEWNEENQSWDLEDGV